MKYMKKVFSKKTKATVRFCLIISLIMSAVFFNLCTSNITKAITDESQLEGSPTSAHQKLYFDALLNCSPLTEISSTNLQKIKQGKTFMSGGTLVENGLYIDLPSNVAYSYWLEYKLTGNKPTVDMGKFRCSQGNGQLAHNDTLSTYNMGFTQKQLICGDGNSGMYEAKVDGYYCEDLYDEDKGSGWSGDQTKVKLSSSGWKNFLYDLAREKTFGGNTPPGGYVDKFTYLETYYIYQDAFFVACAAKTPRSEGIYKIKTWDSTTKSFKEAYYSAAADGLDPDTAFYLWSGKKMTCREIENAMNNGLSGKAYQDYMEREAADPTTPDPDPYAPGSSTPDPAESEPTCMSKAGTSLGWILCPVLEDGVQAVEGERDSNGNAVNGNDGIYSAIKNMLAIDKDLISSEDSDGTIKAWRVFLGIANMGLIVLVIIIIFSQLTGVGIDNYGIKKILPRLIVTILLIELSYIICQLAVDLSNIVGHSASKLLDGVSQYVKANNTGAYVEYGLAAVFSGIFGGVAIAGTVAPTVLSVIALGMPMGIIVCVLALIPVIVAVILFFVMLGLRQVLAIACVVLSPLAFLCYALPNTKSVFSKWLNLFKGVLVVFPICSLLYGIGQIIKTVVLVTSSGAEAHWWIMIVAVMCPFLPFLLAPALIKGSFAALGNLSSKLQNVGSRVKGASANARQSLAKSDMYSDALAKNTGKRLDNINEKIASGKGGKLRRKYYDHMQGRLQTQNARLAADAERRNSLKDPGAYAAAMAGIKSKAFNDKVSDYEAMFESDDGIDMDGNKISSSSSTQDIGTAFEKAIDSDNTELALALKKKLEARGDEGTAQIGGALDRLHANGKGNKSSMQTVLNNIAGDANYKSKNREIFNFANDMRDQGYAGSVQNVKSRYGNISGSFGYADVRGLSDNTFKGIIEAAKNGDSEATQLLQEAYNNPQSNLKINQRSDIEGVHQAYTGPKYSYKGGAGSDVVLRQKMIGGDIVNEKGEEISDLHLYAVDGSEKQYASKTDGAIIQTYQDVSGRTIDASSGKVVDLDNYTLK